MSTRRRALRWLRRRVPLVRSNRSDAARRRFEFAIGIYAGDSPFRLVPPGDVRNPVLTAQDVSDTAADFVADPFMVRANGAWYMFFEVLGREDRKGKIGLAVSRDEKARRWAYQRIVLEEPFHLSYPYVFEWAGDYYMVPESHGAGAVRLYRAARFPMEWSFVATLLSGPCLLDPSILRFGDRWWLFIETNPYPKFDTLRLYHAVDLLGPWAEHPASPIVRGNARTARPAGRIMSVGETIVRFAQDCLVAYGTQVRALKITRLTPTAYKETELRESPILTPSGSGWNATGMHHIDPHSCAGGQWIACVDGWQWLDTA